MDAAVLKADILSTVYLENNGSKGYKKMRLPIEAQYAPVYAINSLDVNNDNNKDLVLGGNNSWTRVKFGQYSANHGIFLTSDGKGNFNYIPQWKSGLNIRGNVRSLQILKSNGNVQLIFGINDSSIKSVSLHEKE